MATPGRRQWPNHRICINTHIQRVTKTAEIAVRGNGIGIGYSEESAQIHAAFPSFSFSLADVGASGITLATVTGLVKTLDQMVGGVHRTLLTLTAVPLTLADATVGAGVKLFDFPKGLLTIVNAAGQVAETTTSVLASTLNTGITYNWGLGTTTQASATLATTEQDIIPVTNGTASATISVAGASSKAVRTTLAQLDGHGTAKACYFNVAVATATDIDGDATTTWTGAVEIWWVLNTAAN